MTIETVDHVARQQLTTHRQATNGQRVRIRSRGREPQIGQESLEPQRARQPVRLGPKPSSRPQRRLSEPGWQPIPDGRFLEIVSVTRVASKSFVPAVAGEHYLDAVASQLRHEISWNGRGVGERLIVK